MEDILVSIWCITYNHKRYIRDAIEGFLNQKTNFKYEIIIHDDASKDGTADIIKEYENKYTDFIHGIYQTENQYSKYPSDIRWINKIAVQNCRGKYIAICEGDDYWIDIQKLQLQVDYLETHPECMMVVHDALNIDCRNYEMKSGSAYEKDGIVPAEDIIVQSKYVFSASMMYRREVLQMRDFFLDAGIADYPTLLYSLTKGSVYYFTRIMSVYRKFHEGSWTASVLHKENLLFIHNIRMINFLKKYNEYTEFKYDMHVVRRIQKSVNVIFAISNKMTIEEFSSMCKKYSKETHDKYLSVFERLEELWLQIFDDSYIDESIYRFVERYSTTIIMGAGKYAGILAKKLLNQGITFEGFAVSDCQQVPESYLDKPVWKLGAMPFDLKKTGVIIGIDPFIWDQIVNSLYKAKIEDYLCPYLF